MVLTLLFLVTVFGFPSSDDRADSPHGLILAAVSFAVIGYLVWPGLETTGETMKLRGSSLEPTAARILAALLFGAGISCVVLLISLLVQREVAVADAIRTFVFASLLIYVARPSGFRESGERGP